jgi:hypothetical protein
MVGSAACATYSRGGTEPTAAHGKTGASARREGESGKAMREAAVRGRHPRYVLPAITAACFAACGAFVLDSRARELGLN